MNIRFTCALLGSLFLASALFAQSSSELFEKYTQAEKAEDWPAAEKAARLGLSKYPAEKGFVSCLSYSLRRQKKYEAALAVIEPWYKKDPNDARLRSGYAYALIDRGWEYCDRKDHRRALDYAERANALLPADEWVVNGYGYLLAQAGKRDEGIDILRRGRKDFPGNDVIRGNLAAALLQSGWDSFNAKNWDTARAAFGEARDLAPEDEWVLNAWGSLLRDSGKLDEGIGVLEHGYAKYPANTFLKGNLLWAYVLAAGAVRGNLKVINPAGPIDWAGAAAWFAKAAALNEKDESYLMHYGLFLADSGRSDEALAVFDEGGRLFPANKYFRNNAAWALIRQVRSLLAGSAFPAAAALAEKAVRRFPNEAWFLVDLADARFNMKEYEASGEAMAALAGLKQPEDCGQPLAADRRELVYFRLMRLVNKFAEAKNIKAGSRLVDRLAAAFPGAWFILEARGVLAYHGGNTAGGIVLVNRAYDGFIALHPEAAGTMTLELPLRGVYWVGGNRRSEAITHAGLNRFCYDFMGANEKGETLKPGIAFPGKSNGDYYGFGLAILCPVDGEVEEVVDLYDDIPPRAVPALGDANIITVKDGAGRHYLFAHNRKGSARVAKGQRVKKGDVLAEIGNNGYSGQPHLHFGVYTPDWLASVQVKFASYALLEDGKETTVNDGVPRTGDIIRR